MRITQIGPDGFDVAFFVEAGEYAVGSFVVTNDLRAQPFESDIIWPLFGGRVEQRQRGGRLALRT